MNTRRLRLVRGALERNSLLCSASSPAEYLPACVNPRGLKPAARHTKPQNALVVVLCLGCWAPASALPAKTKDRLRVYVSIPPQKYFVQRVGQDHVDVSVLLPPGQSPGTFEITARQLASLASADVYFRIGLPFENSVVNKIEGALKHLNIQDTRRGIEPRTPATHHEHNDCGHGHHQGDARDPHVWMNPRLAGRQAVTICDELVRLDPDNRDAYEENLQSLLVDLARIDKQIATALAPLRGREFFVFHPAFGYFADAYGLKQVAVEAGGKSPTARQLGALINRAKRSGVKLIFVQPQFDRRYAETVAQAIGGAVVPMDPLAEDYLANLLDLASKIEQALGGVTRPCQNESK